MITIEPHIKALIFDCDGTLADTMPMHYLAWRATTQANGGDFPEDVFYGTGGMPSEDIVELLNKKYGYSMDPNQIAKDKEQMFLDCYLNQVQPIEPILAIAKAYHGQLPLAVATGGIPKITTKTLQTIGAWDLFETIVTAHDVTHGKPAPDTYLEAARRLNVSPQLCHAFEDTDLGVQSAEKAGMTVTDVRKLLQNGQGG
ncbi:HAD-IA family hydrolase [Anaerolineales bacterium HSG6]|nr:HAD-IA family hydrolase [Anaerolineales bacterium HSG6]MDM8532839.1 HAD-IA family hydrolase [Anaerolineales bacterium HSG25]